MDGNGNFALRYTVFSSASVIDIRLFLMFIALSFLKRVVTVMNRKYTALTNVYDFR